MIPSVGILSGQDSPGVLGSIDLAAYFLSELGYINLTELFEVFRQPYGNAVLFFQLGLEREAKQRRCWLTHLRRMGHYRFIKKPK